MRPTKTITSWDEVPVVMDLTYAARIFCMSAEGLKRLAQTGKFPAFKCGGAWRVSKEQLFFFMNRTDKCEQNGSDLY
ncbi:MAG: helix-turn-helix domain-containing protein [Oscillospiraceae bacterium]